MKTYFVQIPCFVAVGRPERTAAPDRMLVIEVTALTAELAAKTVEETIKKLVQRHFSSGLP